MQTLLFTLEYPPFQGGVSKVYEKLVEHWPGPEELLVLNNNKSELVNPQRKFLKWLPSFTALHKVVREKQIKHVIVGHLLPLGITAWLLSYFLDFEYSVIMHGMDYAFSQKTPRKRFITTFILKRSKKIICGNAYLYGLMEKESKTIGKQKITVINPGIDPFPGADKSIIEAIRTKYSLENKRVLLSLGRIVKRKGIDNVIRSMSVVAEKHPDVFYMIAGIGPDQDLIVRAIGEIEEKYRNNIVILGKLNEAEKWAWLEICDVFITVSRDIGGDFEGFGIVYLEANSAGKPVIAGDSGGVRDAVADGVSGLLVEPQNIKAISSAINKLMDDGELRKKLGDQGRARALSDFDWRGQTKKIYNFINDTL